MLPRKFFDFELVQELVHPVGIDTWLETVDEGADLEPRRLYRFLGHSKADPQGLIHCGLEALASASDSPLQPFGDIRVQSEGGTHDDIMMLVFDDVKMFSGLKGQLRNPE